MGMIDKFLDLTTLSAQEIVFILDNIGPDFGYSDNPKVAQLQGKLSIMLEVRQRMGDVVSDTSAFVSDVSKQENNMTETVSPAVADGIIAIKTSNRCNMNDAVTVIRIARELKHLELADLIIKDEASYRRCLAHGYVVEEDVTTVESAVVEEDVEISEADEFGEGVEEDDEEESDDSTS